MKKALDISPDYIDARTNLANAYMLQGRFAESIREGKKALALNPDYSRSLFNLAVLYDGKGELTKAKELYMEALRRNPGDIRIQGHIRSLEERAATHDTLNHP